MFHGHQLNLCSRIVLITEKESFAERFEKHFMKYLMTNPDNFFYEIFQRHGTNQCKQKQQFYNFKTIQNMIL